MELPEYLHLRGATYYVRRRIPANILAAYPPKKYELTRSLRTGDLRVALERLRAQLTKMDAEFRLKRSELDLGNASYAPKRVTALSDEQLQGIAQYWVNQVLESDDKRRQEGLDDDEFDELAEQLTAQRKDLGRMLAQGRSLDVFPGLHGFLHLCGLEFDPSKEEAKRASHAFLKAAVQAVDFQLARQAGDVVETEVAAPAPMHPLQMVYPERAPKAIDENTWDRVFDTWCKYDPDRKKGTTTASGTAWIDLQRFCAGHSVDAPGQVTPKLMTGFVDAMVSRSLAPKTINQRLAKVRGIYKIAVGKHLLPSNPAAGTLGVKINSAKKRAKRRLPFHQADLDGLFGSPIYCEHLRSRGQAREASYWIPPIMFYSGARPEEVAGLAIADVKFDADLGWYFNIVDRPCAEADEDLFDDDEDAEVPESHRRTLKNTMSIRKVPVAQGLIDLGLLRYIEWLRSQGEVVLFPTLKKDWHEKLSGAFGKFFTRYLREVVKITDPRKVLYSFRHTMKDLLERAQVPSKYLQRLLGHTTGDGEVTDGYGSDLPFDIVVEHFSRVRFPAIPAKPWEPGRGFVRLKQRD